MVAGYELLEARQEGGRPVALRSYYQFDPSVPIAVLALVFYAITTFLHFFQYFRYRAWILTVLLIAGLMQTLGYLARVFSARDVHNRGLYIGQFTLIILAPVLTAAGDYVVLGKLLERVLPGEPRAKTLGLPARWITWIFVTGDIISFVMQGIGAGVIAASVNKVDPSGRQRGTNIVVGGLVVQLIFFTFFTGAVVRFDVKTRADYPGAKWRVLVYALYVSCACILIRSIYRLVEFAEGWTGYLMKHEVYFWVLETLPMLICLVLFNIWHPAKLIPVEKPVEEEVVMTEGRVDQPKREGASNSNYQQLE
ncbi:hypothetical protein DRE_02247 [Drechslerella stenobrocha 248]|uniref:Uncharacterized protein n=1 Tax=Drechslerella stenobrocha 248 TaxID=1043628 RepID=W7I871_9PEZI|nr:hypothetical protein DRE_02247 [Drechslerella stenobrocha 248]